LARTLGQASPVRLALYGGLTTLVLTGYALRWRMASRAVGGHPLLGRLIGARLAGDALSSLVPSARLAGEPVRIALGRGTGDAAVVSASGVALDRLFEVIGNMLAVTTYVGILIALRHAAPDAGDVPRALGAVMLALLVAMAAFVYRMRRGTRPLAPLYGARARRLAPRLSGWMDGLSEVEDHLTRFFRERPGTVAAGIAGSLLIELGCVLQYHTLLAAFGIVIDLPTLLMVMLGSGVARAMPAPGGLGVLEAAQVAVVGAATGRADLGFVVGLVVRMHETLLLAIGLSVIAYHGQSLVALRRAAQGRA
jgi:uncharacterized protein (TIRG00374 family)